MVCHVRLLAGLALTACFTLGLSADPIVIKPPAGKTGAHKVLIVINGALVSNDNYVEVARAVQSASELNLWVAIPSFVINTPNPAQIGSKITGAIAALEKSGFPGTIKSDSDVIVAGHSLGGIFSQSAVVSGGYAGLVLFGSYLSSYTVDNYPKPALTLAGELDGLTRITRIAKSWTQLQELIGKKGNDAQYTRPVIALPGQTHSQFCSNVNVTSFGMKDKCPEVSLATAHAAIGSAVSAFLSVVHASGDVSAAKAHLASGMKYTGELVSGYLKAYEGTKAGDWCKHAQQQEALMSKAEISIDVTSTSNFASFYATNPSIDGNKVQVVQEIQYKLNPTDLSTMDFSGQEIDCKVKTAAALAKAMGNPAPPQVSNTCESVNAQAVDAALDLVSEKTKERYSSSLKPLATEKDEECSTGITWQAASFTFDTNEKSTEVSSPRLTTALDASLWAGNQLCKYLSPDRVIEYMMIDGLPAFDACPKRTTTAEVMV